jgi:plastocyanin
MSSSIRATLLLALLIATLAGASCNSPLSPSSAATITITADGVSPKEVRIKAWNHVSFVNNDSRPHNIVSDPINFHTDCPQINEVGYLPPGSTRDTQTLNLTRTCGFHDHLNLEDDSLRGRIVVE